MAFPFIFGRECAAAAGEGEYADESAGVRRCDVALQGGVIFEGAEGTGFADKVSRGGDLHGGLGLGFGYAIAFVVWWGDVFVREAFTGAGAVGVSRFVFGIGRLFIVVNGWDYHVVLCFSVDIIIFSFGIDVVPV